MITATLGDWSYQGPTLYDVIQALSAQTGVRLNVTQSASSLKAQVVGLILIID
jgi:hypothetical protein